MIEYELIDREELLEQTRQLRQCFERFLNIACIMLMAGGVGCAFLPLLPGEDGMGKFLLLLLCPVIFMLMFAHPGMIRVMFGFKRVCPRCLNSLDHLRLWDRNRGREVDEGWLIASGLCPFCHHKVLSGEAPHVPFREGKRYPGFLLPYGFIPGAVIVLFAVLTGVLLFITPFACLAVIPFGVLFLLRHRIGPRLPCPGCGGNLAAPRLQALLRLTGGCGFCGAKLLKEVEFAPQCPCLKNEENRKTEHGNFRKGLPVMVIGLLFFCRGGCFQEKNTWFSWIIVAGTMFVLAGIAILTKTEWVLKPPSCKLTPSETMFIYPDEAYCLNRHKLVQPYVKCSSKPQSKLFLLWIVLAALFLICIFCGGLVISGVALILWGLKVKEQPGMKGDFSFFLVLGIASIILGAAAGAAFALLPASHPRLKAFFVRPKSKKTKKKHDSS